MKILIIGGDCRMQALLRHLSERHEVSSFATGADDKVPTQEKLWQSLPLFDTVILPLPSTRDGINVNTPQYNEKIAIKDVIEARRKKSTLLCAMLPNALISRASECGLQVLDYYEEESFCDKNAYITAEGALEIVMNRLQKTLRDSHHVIIGGGRIARHLLLLLRGVGAKVSLLARDPHDILWASAVGAQTADLLGDTDKIGSSFARADAIYNTVPTRCISASCYGNAKKSAIYVELATKESLAPELFGGECVCAPALPAKYAPESAGELICEAVTELLENRRAIE